jgi:ribonuclease P protein component
MLSKVQRLTRQLDFTKINRSSRPFYTSALRLKLLPNRSDFNRFAVVVSTKVSKKATKRNRLRRQIREIIRLNQPKIKSGYNIIISAQTAALNFDYQQLQQEFFKLLAKAKLQK